MRAQVGFQPVVDALGRAITTEAIPSGSVLLIEDVEQRYAVSRSVAREAVRMLESLGLLAMKRRVGCTVQPRHDWLVSDPRVIAWRLEGPHQSTELDQLMQLRAGIEPIAARLAAIRRTDAESARLVELADLMLTLGGRGEGHGRPFLAADVEFHTLVLTVGRNDHFAAFADVFATVLTERNQLCLLDAHPDPIAMRAHVDIARSVLEGDADASECAARLLVEVVSREVLAGHPGAANRPRD